MPFDLGQISPERCKALRQRIECTLHWDCTVADYLDTVDL
jgi:hypothetical protein